MPNTYVNKVVYGNTPLIDLTSDTVTAADVAAGVWFHLATGERVEGTASGGGGSGGNVWQDAQGYVHLDDEGGGGGGGGSNDFVVTLAYNDASEMWEPDCTHAEAEAAAEAMKNVVFAADQSSTAAWGLYIGPEFEYYVDAQTSEGLDAIGYVWDSSGVYLNFSVPWYYTGEDTATASDVASGKTFHSSNGYEVGTASGGMPSGFAVGTLTVASDVTTTSSVKITDTTELGFTPTKFYFYATSNPESAGAIYTAVYEGFASYNVRMRAYFSNNALSASAGATSWTSSTSGHLYFSSNTVYINASSTYVLKAGTYGWVAIQ